MNEEKQMTDDAIDQQFRRVADTAKELAKIIARTGLDSFDSMMCAGFLKGVLSRAIGEAAEKFDVSPQIETAFLFGVRAGQDCYDQVTAITGGKGEKHE